MRITIYVVFLLLSSLRLSAQMAPDFTITDSHGQVHHLYADYLNQGKTVLLEVFFTDCPPCNSIAPLMEPFYQEWGAGDHDVEFILLSNKNYDTNILVNNFLNNYGETCPAAGVEGNSLPTVQPYMNGTFGTWYGTPCFIVVAPDGTLQYHVHGSGNQGTIDAIDAAITATGAQKPGQIPTAPDFTLTDTDNNLHHLYADYLNHGKTVVLEIYNTTCGNCTSIASLLQPLYEDWGGGDGDVEIFSLTDRPADVNSVVFNFQEQYNQTFPGISASGGSLAAVVPYENGTYGVWPGAPMFVVIAPDGTFQYNVHGANNNATITALNTAITATGAQPGESLTQAPDFTVTDSHGQVHHLYADYLNHGKSVLLEVFYTTSSPCNSIAPLMEPFYQEWGAGQHDVEFLELSDKNFDTNGLINDFRTQYGETFIGAGKDGGSLPAISPYKNGSFGSWTGNPMFVVIAPDKTVQYDINGANNQATIDAIDAALLATGAHKPEQPVTMTGSVKFLQGTAGVNGATVEIVNGQGTVLNTVTSNSDGSYSLQLLQSEVQPDWALKVIKNGSPTNGVSALDLVRIQKHILFTDPIQDPLLRLAADANRNGSINSLDIIVLVRLLLGITNNFPDNETWITFPADTDLGPPSSHPPVITSYTIPVQDILNGSRIPNFIAVKKGDANGNANPG